MARIPLGDFGQVVARPVERPSGDAAAYGAGMGRALEQSGTIGMQVAGRQIAEKQAEQDLQRRQDDAEAKANQRQLEADIRAGQRQAEAEARALGRQLAAARATTVQATTINDLRDLEREIAAGIDGGTLVPGKAVEEFDKRARKLVDSRLDGLEPVEKELAGARLIDNIGAARLAVGDMVANHGRKQLLANKEAFFEQMQRHAAAGPKEADEAIARVRAYPAAGEDPKQAQARVQQFAERVRFQQATALVNTDPAAALKALKDQKYLPELDPGARTNLIHTADARVTQAANRAEIAARAHERRLETQWKALSTVFEAGKVPDAATTEAARRQFKGTPYAAAFEAMVTRTPETAAFASRPLEVQSQALMAMQAKMNTGGASPDDIEAYKRAEKAYNAAKAEAGRDPYQAAAERGVIVGVAPLSLDIQSLPAQLAARAADAQKVSQWAGREVSLFRPGEAEKIGDVLAAMPPKDRAGALVGLSKVMTPGQRQAFAEQIEPKDKALALAMAYTDAKTTHGRYVSEMVLRGQQARLDKTSTKGMKEPDATVGQWSAEFASSLDGVFPSQQTSNAVREAAMLISHGIAAEQGGGLTKQDRERALRLAIGGEIVEHNGARIPLPAGVDEDMLAKRLRSVTPAEIGGGDVIAGGVKMPAEQFIEALPGAQLMPARPGQYAVIVGGRPVIGANGRPVLIGVTP